MITHHTQLLNALIEKHGLKSFLEIGVQNPANNFDKIKCHQKVGVDPECGPLKLTSDEYFHLLKTPSEQVGIYMAYAEIQTFDLIFIDGLHHAEQVRKDFENSLRCLSDKGFILIHDVLPENEAGTIVPRETKVWWGDVYKWAMNIRQYWGIGFKTFNIDNGCMLVWKTEPNLTIKPHIDYAWAEYKTYGGNIMNVTDEVNI